MTHKKDNGNYETVKHTEIESEVGVLTGSRAGHNIKFGCIFLLLQLTLIMFKGMAKIVNFPIKIIFNTQFYICMNLQGKQLFFSFVEVLI